MQEIGPLLQVGLALVAAGAVYGGIRSDLRSMMERLARTEKRVDSLHARVSKLAG